MITHRGRGFSILVMGVVLALAYLGAWSLWSSQAPIALPVLPIEASPLALPRDQLVQALQGDVLNAQQLLDWLSTDEATHPDASPLNSYLAVSSLECENHLSTDLEHPNQQVEDLFDENTSHITQNSIEAIRLKPILAQSYSAATIALALTTGGCQPGQIAAIPSEIRKERSLHDPKKMESVLYDTDHMSSEQIYLLSPVCIVANFSSPATLQRYRRQKMLVETLPPPTSLEAIWKGIDIVAACTGHTAKGKQLHQLCNRATTWLSQELQKLQIESDELIILQFTRHFSLPSEKNPHVRWIRENLVGGVRDQENPSRSWSKPIDYETLHSLKPRYILIICDQPQQMKTYLEQKSRWRQLIESNQCHYAITSSTCLQSPTQLIVLGLYDVVGALKALKSSDQERSE